MAVSTRKKGEMLERQQKAFDLWRAGATIYEVAEQTGVKPQTAAQDIRRSMAHRSALLTENADTYIAKQLARLERLFMHAMLAVQSAKSTVKDKAAATNAAVRVLERQAKLLGLDAPERHEVSGPLGGPIPLGGGLGEVPFEQLQERFERLREALASPHGAIDVVPVVAALPAAPETPMEAYERVLAARKGNGHA